MNTHISRRTLAKGAAWSAPVIAATAVVPAYASSQCSAKDAGLHNDVKFYYGDKYDSGHQTTDQYFNIHIADAYYYWSTRRRNDCVSNLQPACAVPWR